MKPDQPCIYSLSPRLMPFGAVACIKLLFFSEAVHSSWWFRLVRAAGSIDLQDISRLVDAAASLTSANEETLQGVLEQLVVPERWVMG